MNMLSRVFHHKTEPRKENELVAQLREALGPHVHQQLLQGGEWGADDDTLRRWLVARKWDLKHSAADLAKHAEWRAAYVPTGRIMDAEVQAELDQAKTFVQGFDKQGHPGAWGRGEKVTETVCACAWGGRECACVHACVCA